MILDNFDNQYIRNNGVYIRQDSGLIYNTKSLYNSFAGTDIVATINVPLIGEPIVIGEIQTLSYSIHRPKIQVRTLGRINPKGFARSGRTIAGSLIFTVFDKHIVYKVLERIYGPNHRIITDEMPPFDITVTFSNEYRQKARLSIYGVEIVNEGQTMSIEDMITENVMNYVATGIDLMTPNINSGS